MSALKETLGFQTEVKQLLQLMIHSLYSNKEIFLRELISNASDAADKLRFEGLAAGAVRERAGAEDHHRLRRRGAHADHRRQRHRHEPRRSHRQYRYHRQVRHQGLFEQLSGDAKKDANLIGQFGVGFYSAFIVADKVTLTTRRAGDAAATRWESHGAGEYTLEQVEKPAAAPRSCCT